MNKNPIHYVVNPLDFGSYENVEILELLATRFDVNHEDSTKNTPMMYAI